MISLRLPEQAQLEVEAAGDRQRGKTMNRLVPQAYITTDEEKKNPKDDRGHYFPDETLIEE